MEVIYEDGPARAYLVKPLDYWASLESIATSVMYLCRRKGWNNRGMFTLWGVDPIFTDAGLARILDSTMSPETYRQLIDASLPKPPELNAHRTRVNQRKRPRRFIIHDDGEDGEEIEKGEKEKGRSTAKVDKDDGEKKKKKKKKKMKTTIKKETQEVL